nr:citrate:proton symporter [uncultured Massilia sp.]
MLATLGFTMVLGFMLLIMTRKMSTVTALLLVPILFGVLAGDAPRLGRMIADGMLQVAPVGFTLMFAVLFFGLMLELGLFDPLVNVIVRRVHSDPVRIALGTALLSMLVSFDGDGTSTALIVIGAFLPIYRRTGMNPAVLLTLLALCAAVSNLTPWGGPLARAASALHLDPNAIFLPLVPAMLLAYAAILLLAWHFGLGERRRLGLTPAQWRTSAEPALRAAPAADAPGPGRRVANTVLTLAVLGFVLSRLVPLPVTFMVGIALALLINFPDLEQQHKQLAAQAGNAFTTLFLILCAGAFTGILNGTRMVDAMGAALIGMVPPALGPYMAAVTALISMPLTFFLSNDAYYFGLLPVLAKTAALHGVPAVEVARASLLGLPVHVLSPLMASFYLVVTMLKLEIGPVVRFALPWAVLCVLVLALGAFLNGAIGIHPAGG